MSASGRFSVVIGSGKPGRCDLCRRKVTWAIVAPSSAGQKARSMPFDGQPVALERFITETGVKFEVWSADALHSKTCQRRVTPRRRTGRRQRAAAEIGQGRIV